MKKVCTMLQSKDFVESECIEAVENQDYPNFEILINIRPEEYDKSRYHNIVLNQNENRERALSTGADYFWMLDDDVIPPSNALSELMLQMGKKKTTINWKLPDGKQIPRGTEVPEKHIIGGWWKHKYGMQWSCGAWVADNTFANFYGEPFNGVIEVDKVDFGCILISREVLEKIHFEHGGRCFKWYGSKTEELTAGACHCLMFAIRAQDLGYRLFMNGNVICEHIDRRIYA